MGLVIQTGSRLCGVYLVFSYFIYKAWLDVIHSISLAATRNLLSLHVFSVTYPTNQPAHSLCHSYMYM